MDIDFNIPTIITKRNVDSGGNPISVKLIEIRQIMDNYSCVVLSQTPDEYNRIYIEGFTEVFDIERLDKKNFKVDYSQGIIYFHPFNIGKAISIEYYGTGYELISASRVFTKVDKYGNVIDTLEEILNRASLQLKLIESLGGAIKVIEKLDEDIKNANNLNAYFDKMIPEATGLKNELDTIVTDAKGWKDQLKQDVEDGKILQPLLHNDIIQGREVKQQLDQSIADAQDDIAKIEATGNEIIYITSSQWTYNDVSKMYEKQITHTCNSENVHVTCKTSDTKEALFLPWKIVDKNNVLLKSDEVVNVSVIISASYYKALIDNTTTQEVIDARKGELTLFDKMNKVDVLLETMANEYTIFKKDYETLQNAINRAVEKNATLELKPIKYELTEYLTIDISKCSIKGNGCIFDFSNAPNELACIKIIGSNKNPYTQNGNFFENVEIIGKGKESSQIAIKFESDSSSHATSHINLNSLNIHDFNKGIVYKTFSYLIRHSSVDVYNCDTCVEMTSGGYDYGENINFYGCAFYNSEKAVVGSNWDGAFHFTSCSIDYCNVNFDISNMNKCFFSNGHIEGQGVFKGSMNIDNSWIVIPYNKDGQFNPISINDVINIRNSFINIASQNSKLVAGDGKLILDSNNHYNTSLFATCDLNDNSSVVSPKGFQIYSIGGTDDVVNGIWDRKNCVITIDTINKETGDFCYKVTKAYGAGSECLFRILLPRKNLNNKRIRIRLRCKSSKTVTSNEHHVVTNLMDISNGVDEKGFPIFTKGVKVDESKLNLSTSYQWSNVLDTSQLVINGQEKYISIDVNLTNWLSENNSIYIDRVLMFEY